MHQTVAYNRSSRSMVSGWNPLQHTGTLAEFPMLRCRLRLVPELWTSAPYPGQTKNTSTADCLGVLSLHLLLQLADRRGPELNLFVACPCPILSSGSTVNSASRIMLLPSTFLLLHNPAEYQFALTQPFYWAESQPLAELARVSKGCWLHEVKFRKPQKLT